MKLISLIINNLTNKVIKKTIKKLSILKLVVYLYHQTNNLKLKTMKITKFDLKIPEFDIDKTSVTLDSEDTIEVDGFNVQSLITIYYNLSTDTIGDGSLRNGTFEEVSTEISVVMCDVKKIFNDGNEVKMTKEVIKKIENLIEKHIKILN